MTINIPKLVVKPIKINLDGLEKVLERRKISGLDENIIKKSFNRYEGTFLLVGNNFFRIPKLNFLKYLDVYFDVDEPGVFSAVVYGNFKQGIPHGHFSDGSIIDFERKGYIGKMDVSRYFRQESFNEIFEKLAKK